MFALGLADFLEDHLFGRLRGDAPEHVGALRELDLHVDFSLVAVEILRFLERDLGRRIGDFLDDVLRGEQVDLARFLVEPRFQVLIGLVVLRDAVRTASSIAVMMVSGSMPFSFTRVPRSSASTGSA